MFLAIVFIALGLAVLLNAFGILNGTFWGFFWGIVLIAIGVRMMMHKDMCSACGWHHLRGKMRGHCCGHDHGDEQEQK
jgi:cadmium resistance protein CadD (predicted permease)